MSPTLSEINIAILMITVVVFLFIWFERSEAAATVTRMNRMMSRVGLNISFGAMAGPKARAIMKEARTRCGRCRCEDRCELWLDEEVKSDNAFCPNAQVFSLLKRASAA